MTHLLSFLILISLYTSLIIPSFIMSSFQIPDQTRKRAPKQYTYIPYDSEESFDKIQSSCNSRSSIPDKILKNRLLKEVEDDQNGVPFTLLNTNIEQQSRATFPLEQAPLWNSTCKECRDKIGQLGKKIGIENIQNQKIKNIIPLPSKNGDYYINYAVQYQNSRFQKFTSKALANRNLKQMVYFLQKQLFDAKQYD